MISTIRYLFLNISRFVIIINIILVFLLLFLDNEGKQIIKQSFVDTIKISNNFTKWLSVFFLISIFIVIYMYIQVKDNTYRIESIIDSSTFLLGISILILLIHLFSLYDPIYSNYKYFKLTLILLLASIFLKSSYLLSLLKNNNLPSNTNMFLLLTFITNLLGVISSVKYIKS